MDPRSSKYANPSAYVYLFNNPLKFIDLDGNDTAGVSEATVLVVSSLAILTAFTIYTVEYVTNSAYRSGYDSYTFSTAHLVSNSVKEIGNFIGSFFSSGESKINVEELEVGGIESVKEQAEKISNEIGKNSVTLPDGTRVDLKGR